VFALLFVLANEGNAQDINSSNKLITGKALTHKAVVLYNKNLLSKADSVYREILKSDTSNVSALFGLTFVQYRFLEMSLQKGNENLFDEYYQTAVDNANKLILLNKCQSEGKSVLAGIYLMKVAKDPMTAVTLFSEMNELLDDAEAADSLNPITYIVRGEMQFNTPATFGGSIENASKNFSKAVRICEQNPVSKFVDMEWEHIEALAWLGQSLMKLENYDAAKFAYQKALSLQPDFGWVKYVLLPEAEKKTQN
jgi:tetratricopeptide (TPR) repeat protein